MVNDVGMTTMYDRVGGMSFFETLTGRFYDGVERDPVLRPLYPEDLADARRHLCLFLAQYFGGPRTYDDERGHPRLRARHLPFAIGPAERDAWLTHMLGALRQGHLSPLDESQMVTYFEAAAAHMVNVTAETA
jgi:hemoglobin